MLGSGEEQAPGVEATAQRLADGGEGGGVDCSALDHFAVLGLPVMIRLPWLSCTVTVGAFRAMVPSALSV